MDNYSKVQNLLANTQQKCAFINKLWTSTDTKKLWQQPHVKANRHRTLQA